MRVLLALFLLFAAVGTSFGSVMTPDSLILVSLDGDRDGPGTVNAGPLAGNPIVVRERANLAEQALRIAAFLDFDLASLPGTIESAEFSVSFDQRLNTANNMAVNIGRVQDDGTNGDSWDDSLAAGTVPLFEWGMNSADASTLVPNVRTNPLGTYSVDVTNIVNKWTTGTNANNGFTMYAPSTVFQGAGFSGATLSVVIPEPTTLLVWSLLAGLGVGLGWRRRK